MLSAGLLLVALAWESRCPDGAALATLVAGAAAALVRLPVLPPPGRACASPSLHGITDQLIALALIAAWASGDLITAAVLPIIMILGHILEERSLLGIAGSDPRALARLAETSARRLDRGRHVESCRRARCGPATGSKCAPATGCRPTASCARHAPASTSPR